MGNSTVQAVLDDLDSAPIAEPLRATLSLLRTVTLSHERLTAEDFRPALSLGVTRAQLEDALQVAFAFNVITRLADTFAFAIGPQEAFEVSARALLRRGYQ